MTPCPSAFARPARANALRFIHRSPALLGLALVSLLASGLAAAEAGALLRDSELRAKPFGDAAVQGRLKAKATVDIVARQGAWAQVKAGPQSGWVRLLNVRTGSGQRGDAGAGALTSMFRTGSSGTTVTTGVKGLSEEKLAQATANPDEARRLDRYRENESGARSFARQAKLSARDQAFFDDDGREVKP